MKNFNANVDFFLELCKFFGKNCFTSCKTIKDTAQINKISPQNRTIFCRCGTKALSLLYM